jgi:hypothetical protein
LGRCGELDRHGKNRHEENAMNFHGKTAIELLFLVQVNDVNDGSANHQPRDQEQNRDDQDFRGSQRTDGEEGLERQLHAEEVAG